jgi:PAS domain S-box-containing protein
MVEKSGQNWSKLAVKGLLLLALPFTIQLLLTLNYAALVDRVETLAAYEYRSKALIGSINWLLVLLETASNAALAQRLEHDPNYRQVVTLCLEQVDSGCSDLLSQSDGSDKCNTELRNFVQTIAIIKTNLKKEVELSGRSEHSALLSDENKRAWEQLHSYRHELLAYERTKLSAKGSDVSTLRHRLKDSLFLGVILDITFGVVLVYLYHINISSRIRTLTDNTVRFADGRELKELPPGKDEISELDSFFRSMAETIAKSKLALEMSEQRQKSLIEYLPLGLITMDEHGTVRSMNDHALELFGRGSSQSIGSNLETLVPGALSGLDGPKGSTYGGEKFSRLELPSPYASGAKKYLELTVRDHTILDERLKLLAIHDITERKELEILREEFTRMVSHDLRSPLASIQLTHQLMLRGDLNPKDRTRLERAEQNIARLLKLVNDLLDFEKLNSGSSPLLISSCDSQSIIKRSVDAIQDLAAQRTITLEVPKHHCTFSAEEDSLIQVLVNLLTNAIKFSPEESSIEISLVEDDDSVEFRIIDHGRGVPSELQKTIFEKYMQVHASDATEKRGIGLGLPICKAIVERHGGKIGMVSEANKGSTFWFRIPKIAGQND